MKEGVHAASKLLLHKALELRPRNEIFIRGKESKQLAILVLKSHFSKRNLILLGIIKFCLIFFNFAELKLEKGVVEVHRRPPPILPGFRFTAGWNAGIWGPVAGR